MGNNLSSGPTEPRQRRGDTELRLFPITLFCFQVTRHNLKEGNLSPLIALRFPQILLRLLQLMYFYLLVCTLNSTVRFWTAGQRHYQS
jgi:hypothetical protein